jgi:hypothetical protein
VSREQLHANDPQFLADITELDRMRFRASSDAASPSWGNPQTAQVTEQLIFRSDNPRDGLTLFVLACWYDMQETYVLVWSQRLRELGAWLSSPNKSEANLPASRTPWPKRSAWATWTCCGKEGFAHYFVRTVNAITAQHSEGIGNIYRFIGRLGLDLTNPGKLPRKDFSILQWGHYSPVNFKRAWMLLMFLRRDQGIIRCLVERALAGVVNGSDALRAWYDDKMFPQSECELPVDSRMLTIAKEVFKRAFTDEVTLINEAQAWGQQHGVSPSTLDALFSSMDAVSVAIQRQ